MSTMSSDADSRSGQVSLRLGANSSLSIDTSQQDVSSSNSASAASSMSISDTSSFGSSYSSDLESQDSNAHTKEEHETDLAKELYLTLRKRGKDGVSKSVIQLIESRFNLIDKNRSGCLDVHEFRQLLISVLGGRDVDVHQAQKLLEDLKIDADGSGKITYDEFVAAISHPPGTIVRLATRLARELWFMADEADSSAGTVFGKFARFKSTGENIGVAELKAMAIACNIQEVEALTTGELDYLLSLIDIEGRGFVDVAAFSSFLEHFSRNEGEEVEEALSPIVDVKLSVSMKEEAGLWEAGYIRNPTSLNDRGWGKKVHLWIKREGASKDEDTKESVRSRVTDVALSRKSKDPKLLANGYECVKHSTNSGAWFVRSQYLWIRRNAQDPSPIMNVAVSAGKAKDKTSRLYTPPYRGFRKLQGDLNRGNSGSQVYLWFSKHSDVGGRENKPESILLMLRQRVRVVMLKRSGGFDFEKAWSSVDNKKKGLLAVEGVQKVLHKLRIETKTHEVTELMTHGKKEKISKGKLKKMLYLDLRKINSKVDLLTKSLSLEMKPSSRSRRSILLERIKRELREPKGEKGVVAAKRFIHMFTKHKVSLGAKDTKAICFLFGSERDSDHVDAKLFLKYVSTRVRLKQQFLEEVATVTHSFWYATHRLEPTEQTQLLSTAPRALDTLETHMKTSDVVAFLRKSNAAVRIEAAQATLFAKRIGASQTLTQDQVLSVMSSRSFPLAIAHLISRWVQSLSAAKGMGVVEWLTSNRHARAVVKEEFLSRVLRKVTDDDGQPLFTEAEVEMYTELLFETDTLSAQDLEGAILEACDHSSDETNPVTRALRECIDKCNTADAFDRIYGAFDADPVAFESFKHGLRRLGLWKRSWEESHLRACFDEIACGNWRFTLTHLRAFADLSYIDSSDDSSAMFLTSPKRVFNADVTRLSQDLILAARREDIEQLRKLLMTSSAPYTALKRLFGKRVNRQTLKELSNHIGSKGSAYCEFLEAEIRRACERFVHAFNNRLRQDGSNVKKFTKGFKKDAMGDVSMQAVRKAFERKTRPIKIPEWIFAELPKARAAPPSEVAKCIKRMMQSCSSPLSSASGGFLSSVEESPRSPRRRWAPGMVLKLVEGTPGWRETLRGADGVDEIRLRLRELGCSLTAGEVLRLAYDIGAMETGGGIDIGSFIDGLVDEAEKEQSGRVVRVEQEVREALRRRQKELKLSLTRMFDELDTDGDGRLSRAELARTFGQVLGLDKIRMQDMDAFFSRFDKNRDGVVDRAEFAAFLELDEVHIDEVLFRLKQDLKNSARQGKSALERFEEMDLNGDGVVSRREFRKALDEITRMKLSDAEAESVMDAYSKSRSGNVDYESFVQQCLPSVVEVSALETRLKARIREGFQRDGRCDYQQAFSFMDPTGQGHITQAQLGLACEKLGMSLAPAEVLALLERFDANNDKRIDLYEFTRFLSYDDNEVTEILRRSGANLIKAQAQGVDPMEVFGSYAHHRSGSSRKSGDEERRVSRKNFYKGCVDLKLKLLDTEVMALADVFSASTTSSHVDYYKFVHAAFNACQSKYQPPQSEAERLEQWASKQDSEEFRRVQDSLRRFQASKLNGSRREHVQQSTGCWDCPVCFYKQDIPNLAACKMCDSPNPATLESTRWPHVDPLLDQASRLTAGFKGVALQPPGDYKTEGGAWKIRSDFDQLTPESDGEEELYRGSVPLQSLLSPGASSRSSARSPLTTYPSVTFA